MIGDNMAYEENFAKLPYYNENDDLPMQDVFQGSNRSLTSCSNHESTEDRLIRQFKSSVGMDSLEPSVASFYLEMCNYDLRASVLFFKEQNYASKKPYPTPSPPVARRSTGSQAIPPKRMYSFDAGYRHSASSIQQRPQHRHGRIKSFDASEAASVTAPNCAQLASFSVKPVPRNSGGGTSPVRFSHRRSTQCVVQLPDRRYASWGRSNSDCYLNDAMHQQKQRNLTASSAHGPTRRKMRSLSPIRGVIRSRSDSKVHHYHQKMQSSMNKRNFDYSEAPSVTSAQVGSRPSTSAPPSPRGGNRGYGNFSRHHSPQRSSWEPPTAKAAHYNPAA